MDFADSGSIPVGTTSTTTATLTYTIIPGISLSVDTVSCGICEPLTKTNLCLGGQYQYGGCRKSPDVCESFNQTDFALASANAGGYRCKSPNKFICCERDL